MTTVFKEPLVLFLLAGAAVFGIHRVLVGPGGLPDGTAPQGVDDPARIMVTGEHLERLGQEWAARWNRPPTDDEFKGLLDAWIKEEILYREALALGLDEGDTIIRRRLAQKMEFLTSDIADLAEPSEEELEAFFRDAADRYRREPEAAFVQVYFNPDRRGASTEADAAALLEDLGSRAFSDDELAEFGDRTLIPIRTERAPLSRIGREFGTEFADALESLPVGEWSGPVRSGFGVHLVRLDERADAVLPPLAEIRPRVLDDFRVEQRKRMNDAVLEELLGRYRVEYEADARPAADADGRPGSADPPSPDFDPESASSS